MIAALVAALMPFVLYVPDELPELDPGAHDAFMADLVASLALPVAPGDHPSCVCGSPS